jgi:hypothetical protein
VLGTKLSMRDWRMASSIAMFINALCVSSGIKRQVFMCSSPLLVMENGWRGCGLKLLCSEKTMAPLYKLNCIENCEKLLVVFYMLLGCFRANTDLPHLYFSAMNHY